MDYHDEAELLQSELVCIGSSSTCSGLDFLYRWMECISAMLSDNLIDRRARRQRRSAPESVDSSLESIHSCIVEWSTEELDDQLHRICVDSLLFRFSFYLKSTRKKRRGFVEHVPVAIQSEER